MNSIVGMSKSEDGRNPVNWLFPTSKYVKLEKKSKASLILPVNLLLLITKKSACCKDKLLEKLHLCCTTFCGETYSIG